MAREIYRPLYIFWQRLGPVWALPNLEQLEQVESNVKVAQCWVEHLEIQIVNVLEHQRRSLRYGVLDYIKQPDDVRSATEILQNLDLPLDLALLHRLYHKGEWGEERWTF